MKHPAFKAMGLCPPLGSSRPNAKPPLKRVAYGLACAGTPTAPTPVQDFAGEVCARTGRRQTR